MIISHKYKFIFIKTVKTAGTSIELFLSKQCDESDIVTPVYPYEEGHIPRNYKGYFNPIPELFSNRPTILVKTVKDLIGQNKYYNHIPASIIRARLPKTIWNNYFKFCVERNPWDKTVSHFNMLKHRSGGALTFDQYLNNRKYCFNYKRYTDGWNRNKIIVDRIVRFERLSEDLGVVFEALGIEYPGKLGARAKGNYRVSKKHYREYYTETTKRVIEKAFEKEIQMHKYTF